jgi:hypothetical protein
MDEDQIIIRLLIEIRNLLKMLVDIGEREHSEQARKP